MPTDTELAYTAGILDGEGCIRILKDTYGLSVTVGNTDVALLDWLERVWGGKIYGKAYQKLKWYPNSKPFKQWQIYGLKATSMLELCIPYMVIKKDRAEVALKMIPLFGKKNNYIPGFNAEMRAKRHEIYCELKVLNQRGILTQ